MIKKKMMVLSGAILFGVLTCGCGSTGIQADTTVSEEANEHTLAETPIVAENEIEKEQEQVQEESFDSSEVYEAFLNNEEVAEISFDADQGYYSSYKETLEDGKSYTLDEIAQGLKSGINVFLESNDDIEISETRNAYIDCGNDGQNELLVAVKFKAPMDTYENKMIFKATKDGLKLCYCGDSWPRKSLAVNEYGYIETTFSGGAYDSSYEKSYVDAEGSWHFLYGNVAEYAERGELWYGSTKYVYSDYGIDMSDLLIFSYYFEKTDDESEPEYLYTYAKMGEYGKANEVPYFDVSIVKDNVLYETGNMYKDFFDQIGMKVYSTTDMAALVEKQLQNEGFDSSLAEGKVVLETEVDF